MIAKVFREEIVNETIKKTREVTKYKIEKKIIRRYEDQIAEPEYTEGYCGRCRRKYKHGENIKEPNKCPRCVCVDCGVSIESRTRNAARGRAVIRCYKCWWEYEQGRPYNGPKRGFEINYSHKPPNLLPRRTIKVEKEEVIEEKIPYIDMEEYLEEVEKNKTIAIDKDNTSYNHTNDIIELKYDGLDDLLDKYLGIENYYFNDEILEEYFEWFGVKSHERFQKKLNDQTNTEEIDIVYFSIPRYNKRIIGEKQTVEEFDSVVGFYPNVPAYIKGHPLNMYNNKRKNIVDYDYSIDIYLNITMDSKNKKEQYKNRGIITYNLIQYLNSQRITENDYLKINLIIFEASFVDNKTLIQKIKFDNEYILKNNNYIYNLLTNISFLRVLLLEIKASKVSKGILTKDWLEGFGNYIYDEDIKKLFNLDVDDFLISDVDSLNIKGENINDDFINAMEALGFNNEYEFVKSSNDDEIIPTDDFAIGAIKLTNAKMERIVNYYDENKLLEVKINNVEELKQLMDVFKIYIKIGLEYSHINLRDKIVLLSELETYEDNQYKYYYNPHDRVLIGEKNILKYYLMKD